MFIAEISFFFLKWQVWGALVGLQFFLLACALCLMHIWIRPVLSCLRNKCLFFCWSSLKLTVPGWHFFSMLFMVFNNGSNVISPVFMWFPTFFPFSGQWVLRYIQLYDCLTPVGPNATALEGVHLVLRWTFLIGLLEWLRLHTYLIFFWALLANDNHILLTVFQLFFKFSHMQMLL